MSSLSHLLTLKVLRLSNPSFDEAKTESDDFLCLPPSFGNIYLGETFTSYLCVNNDSLTTVQNVAFKAELQTASQRFTLADTIGSVASSSGIVDFKTGEQVSLLPRQSSEFVLHHEIKELGIHILVCSVHYTPIQNEISRKFFRKFFKFQVLNPLSVKTRVISQADDRILLELQLSNLAHLPLFLKKVDYQVDDLFTACGFNGKTGSENTVENIQAQGLGENIFPTSILQPQGTRQYLFVLKPKPEHIVAARLSANLGRLDLEWCTTMGQSGHLQTSRLTRKVPSIEPIQLSIINTPKRVIVEKPFSITFRIRNNISDGTKISLEYQKSSHELQIVGKNCYDIGKVDGNQFIDFELKFIGLIPGSHVIKGLSLTDQMSGAVVKIDSLPPINIFPF
jgi:trafficking protein particle complex subunit 13